MTLMNIENKNYIEPEVWAKMDITEKHEVEKRSLFQVLDCSTLEDAMRLREKVIKGEIDGSTYYPNGSASACQCILGTIAIPGEDFSIRAEEAVNRLQDCSTDAAPLMRDGTYFDEEEGAWFDPEEGDIVDIDLNFVVAPIETMAYNLSPGDTPEKSETARVLLGWIDEWIAKHDDTDPEG